MKKLEIPPKEKIAEMDEWFEEQNVGIKVGQGCIQVFVDFELSPEFGPVLEKWGNDHKIPRRLDMGFFSDFFEWYEISDTPLYKVMREEE